MEGEKKQKKQELEHMARVMFIKVIQISLLT